MEIFFQYLEFFLNGLEFAALAASVGTFFILMLNQYSKALKIILGPSGLSLWPRIRVLVICRSSIVKKRAFIEFAIMKTQGYASVPSKWHSIINEFKAYYQEGQSEQLYIIPNCTCLISEEFSEVTERYFTFFSSKKARDTFGIHDDRIAWVTKLRIEDAYVTPTCLLTGLLSKYEESWSEFIKRFVSTAYISESDTVEFNDILSNELYFTFAWLLWGPSYELNHKDYWTGLCQISFGDESNSVPAVADRNSDVANRLLARINSNTGRRYGALISADVSVFKNKEYYNSLKESALPAESYFYDKISDGSQSFAIQIDNFSPCESYKAQKYYCTAYVWVLFEQEDGEFEFKPEKSVAFFEHANLTDESTYHFLISTLIDKCIKHFESVFSNELLAKRKYRFICSMNDRITKELIARLTERANGNDALAVSFKERIILESKHRPADVFAAFDDFFEQNDKLTFEEISLSDKNSITDLATFYTQIYMECFPDKNERETFDSLLSYLKDAESATNYSYHIIVAKDNEGNVVAGAIFDYFKASNSAVIEFIAVRSDIQSGGIGSIIYKEVIKIVSEDAFMHRKEGLKNIFCEIDSPEYSQASVKKYLYFWNKFNFRRLDFSYLQPALSASQEAVTGLWLTVVNFDGEAEVNGNHLLSVIGDYMRYAMRIADPENHPDYKKMKKELKNKKRIPRLPII